MYQKVQKENYTVVAIHIIIPRSYNYASGNEIKLLSSISFPLASSQQNLFDIYLMLYVQS